MHGLSADELVLPSSPSSNNSLSEFLMGGSDKPQEHVRNEIVERMIFLSSQKTTRRKAISEAPVAPSAHTLPEVVPGPDRAQSPGKTEHHSCQLSNAALPSHMPTLEEMKKKVLTLQQQLEEATSREERTRKDAEEAQNWLERDLETFQDKILQLEEEKRDIFEENLMLEDASAELHLKLKMAERVQGQQLEEIQALQKQLAGMKEGAEALSQASTDSGCTDVERVWDDEMFRAAVLRNSEPCTHEVEAKDSKQQGEVVWTEERLLQVYFAEEDGAATSPAKGMPTLLVF